MWVRASARMSGREAGPTCKQLKWICLKVPVILEGPRIVAVFWSAQVCLRPVSFPVSGFPFPVFRFAPESLNESPRMRQNETGQQSPYLINGGTADFETDRRLLSSIRQEQSQSSDTQDRHQTNQD